MVIVEHIREKYDSNRLKKLGKKLRDLGWRDLKWGPYHSCPSGIDLTEDGFWMKSCLTGCPPDYCGQVEDYNEIVVITLTEPNKFEEVGVMIRKKLDRLYFNN